MHLENQTKKREAQEEGDCWQQTQGQQSRWGVASALQPGPLHWSPRRKQLQQKGEAEDREAGGQSEGNSTQGQNCAARPVALRPMGLIRLNLD